MSKFEVAMSDEWGTVKTFTADKCQIDGDRDLLIYDEEERLIAYITRGSFRYVQEVK